MAVNVRVEYKKIPGKSDDYCVHAMRNQFRKKCGDVGIAQDIKRHQFFESESVRRRRRNREMDSKRKLDSIAERLLQGEKIKCSSKIIKSIRSKQAKEVKSKKRLRQRDGDYGYK